MRLPRGGAAVRIALVSATLYAVVCLVIGLTHDGRAEWFVKFGRNDAPMLDRSREVLGHEPTLGFVAAHDGPLYWTIARDPLLLDPDRTASVLDAPTYRARRILYPALAAPTRIFGEQGLLWGLVAVNVVAVGVGTYLTARLAAALEAPTRAALAFPLNPAVIIGVMLDLGDVVACTAVVGLVLAVRWRRWGWAVAAGMAAVLAREYSLVAVVAVAVGAVGLPVRRRLLLGLAPAAALALWSVYAGVRLGWRGGTVRAFEPVPLAGWFEAYRDGWSADELWGDFVLALAVAALAVVVLVRWARTRRLEMWAAAGYAVLVPISAASVVFNPTNSGRLLGPGLTLLAVDVYRRAHPIERWPRWWRRAAVT